MKIASAPSDPTSSIQCSCERRRSPTAPFVEPAIERDGSSTSIGGCVHSLLALVREAAFSRDVGCIALLRT
jgi:hypothetical protein